MGNTNFLANIFDWFGETFERFNPSAFRFLAAFLPYLSPVPVALITVHSASVFLGLDGWGAGILVFVLEGIGLWFTSLLVDAVVGWVRSQNWKSAAIVVMFLVAIGVYIGILINLNVTIEAAMGNSTPERSRVILLLCFLPLLTGIGNGYYKLMLNHQTQTEIAKEKDEELQEKIRQEKTEYKLKRQALKQGINIFNPSPVATLNQDVPVARIKVASDFKESAIEMLNATWDGAHRILQPAELTAAINKKHRVTLDHSKCKGTWSNFTTEWKKSKGL